MREVRRIINVVLTLTIFTFVSVGQVNAKHKELPNFHQVNLNLYRGAQPKKGGLQRLAQLGIKTIVNLRGANDRSRTEEREAHRLGLRYYSVPMGWYGRPKDEQIERVLRIISAPENQPVFVHCRRGADRTGTIVAIYRILNDGWTSERAKEEADRYGMRWWRFGMKDYISDYYERVVDRSESELSSSGSRLPVPRRLTIAADRESAWMSSQDLRSFEVVCAAADGGRSTC